MSTNPSLPHGKTHGDTTSSKLQPRTKISSSIRVALPSLLQEVLKQYLLNSASLYMHGLYIRSQTVTRLGMRTDLTLFWQDPYRTRMGDNNSGLFWTFRDSSNNVIATPKMSVAYIIVTSVFNLIWEVIINSILF